MLITVVKNIIMVMFACIKWFLILIYGMLKPPIGYITIPILLILLIPSFAKKK